MTKLTWDNTGDRYFEAGVDRGVLYTTDGSGIPWNGLTSVKQNPSGGEPAPYFLDGRQYANVPSREKLNGNIEAFTYPKEFGIHDGTYTFENGLTVSQQRRLPFALSYRTLKGNDVEGTEYGYRLHIIYNVLAQPSSYEYSTTSADVDPLKFSWDFSTTPIKPVSDIPLAPLAHVAIDSTETAPNLLAFIEQQLYGTTKKDAKLITLNELIDFFEHPQGLVTISVNTTTGINDLIPATTRGDLFGSEVDGIYAAPDESRLIPTAIPGLYTLES